MFVNYPSMYPLLSNLYGYQIKSKAIIEVSIAKELLLMVSIGIYCILKHPRGTYYFEAKQL